MSENKRCHICGGSGQVMGGGMIFNNCEECGGKGKIIFIEDEIEELNIRNTESYQNAIKEIKAIDSSIDDEKAKEIFEKEYSKLSKENKKGRR